MDNYLLSLTDRAGNTANINIVITEKSEIDDWTYELDDINNTVILNKYIGNDTDVTVYDTYEVNGKEYTTELSTFMSPMFSGNSNIKTITFVDNLDTSHLANLSSAFSGCSSLTTVNFGKNFDSSNVISMNYMFNNCSSLTNVNLNKLNTSKVKDMSRLFIGCSSLARINVSNFDTSKVTNMAYMFANCSSLETLDLSNFVTSSIKDVTYMFSNCSKLNSVYVSSSKWVTTGATTSGMFNNCGVSKLTRI